VTNHDDNNYYCGHGTAFDASLYHYYMQYIDACLYQ